MTRARTLEQRDSLREMIELFDMETVYGKRGPFITDNWKGVNISEEQAKRFEQAMGWIEDE